MGVATEVSAARRLGNNVNNNTDGAPRRRPILLTVASRYERDMVLEKAKTLKSLSDVYSKIYIKKDVNPSIRNEWKRLRDAEKTEKERPENIGCNIHLNTRERKLYKDGVVIDNWSLLCF